jgi:hypothetical protein
MAPILCIEVTDLLPNAACFLQLGNTLALPIINHYGTPILRFA